MNSISFFKNIRSKVESKTSLFDQKFSSFRSNSNHSFSSRIFQNQIYFINNSIIFFYLFGCFDISIRKLYENDEYQIKKFSYFDSTFRQYINIKTIFLVWKSARKHIHRFIKLMFFFYSFDELDITSKIINTSNQKVFISRSKRNLIQKSFIFDENFAQTYLFFLSIDHIFWFQR